MRRLTILGGYDAEFSARDPWKNPTRFVLDVEEKAKGNHNGTFLQSGDEPSDGLILDGLVFDGSSANTYATNGSLDLKLSPLNPLVEVRGGREPLVVRNSVFINASGAAIVLRCPMGTFENNVVVNTSGLAVGIAADGMGPWIVRNNTILFAADPTPRAGTGVSSTAGTLLRMSGRAAAVIEGNILAFGDNYGLRSTLPKSKVSLNGNVLAGNLYCDFTDAQYVWAHTANFQRRMEVDADFVSARGNLLQLPRVELAPEFADAALGRLYGLPSRLTEEQWKALAGATGAGVPPSGKVQAPPPVVKPASGRKEPSIDDLLADLGKLKEETTGGAKPVAAVGGPVYCPALEWKKAIALVQEAGTGAGAHRAPAPVVFGPGRGARPVVQYLKLRPAELDARRAGLEKQTVELEVQEVRSSLTEALFPADTSKNDYDAYTVSLTGGDSQTRVALVVRRDTAASKAIDRVGMRDTVRVRGMARLTGSRGVSIVVDSLELVDK